MQEVIKDVYRDLLSPNDKAMQQAQAQKQQQQQEQRAMPLWSYLQAPGENNEDKNLPRFKGLLSVGVEELTNTLIVSAPQWLLTDVVTMAERLDRQAEPMRPVVNVLKLQNSGTSAYLKGTNNGNTRRLTPSRSPPPTAPRPPSRKRPRPWPSPASRLSLLPRPARAHHAGLERIVYISPFYLVCPASGKGSKRRDFLTE